MNLLQSIRMAFKAIGSNKSRSLLTMLGIIIGVLAVSMLISVVQGATGEITGQLEALGSNMLAVTLQNKGNTNLTAADLQQLVTPDNGIALMSPSVSGKGPARSATRTMTATLTGVNADYLTIRSLSLAAGRAIQPADDQYRTAVAVIGTGVADELFGQRNVIGNTINVQGRNFTIIGLLEEEGGFQFNSNDDTIFVPFVTAQRLLQNAWISSFFVSCTSADTVETAKDVLKRFLLARVRDEDSYSLISQTDILGTLSSVTDTLSLLLGGIAGISLLVGGIGIMNIMLVSVTERTREIGIRKAIGAKRKNILTQFMIEALVISLVGGLIGLVISSAGVSLIGSLMGVSMRISAGIAMLSLGFSAAVGLVFGLYPAAKASRLVPVQALRYE